MRLRPDSGGINDEVRNCEGARTGTLGGDIDPESGRRPVTGAAATAVPLPVLTHGTLSQLLLRASNGSILG